MPPKRVRSDAAIETIKRWLAANHARRILVLLDEADSFILADASARFSEFIKLQSLMDSTQRRFKFVLAGLHNVTRLVHTENPPLKQIASDPQRIGALMDQELADAERLVTRPFAGMGYRFDNREDVWRILSYCNYYPVLVQKFCRHLLAQMVQETRTKRRPVFVIGAEHVRSALESDEIARDIGETFDHTIKIELRYELLANIMAQRALRDAAEGVVSEGMSAVEVRDTAVRWWPEAFKEVHRLSIVEDLLDEMEGLGVVRRVPRDRWALRSPAILRLLGDQEKVQGKLEEFIGREAPKTFDPRSSRRLLEPSPRLPTERHVCPLTQGQEHDILRGDAAAVAVFGNALSDIHLVAHALAEGRTADQPGGKLQITARVWHMPNMFLQEIRSSRLPPEGRALFVVDVRSSWDGGWIYEALRSAPVRDGRLRLVFVGGPEHALKFVTDARFAPPPPKVRVMPLEPWSPPTLPPHAVREAFGQAQTKWIGVVSRTDTQLYAESMLDWGLDGLAAKVAIATVTEVAGYDPQLLRYLAQQPLAQQLDPRQALRRYPNTAQNRVPSWSNGLVDEWDGAPYLHSLAMLGPESALPLERRVWRGHVRALFPVVEHVRHAFAQRYERFLLPKLPFEKDWGGYKKTFETAHTLEITDLARFLRQHVPQDEYDVLQAFTRIRRALAHQDACRVDTINEAHDGWREIADRFPDAWMAWEWPRCGQRLTLLIGPSGAGKSTFASQNYAADEVISSDAIREKIYGSMDMAGDQSAVFEKLRNDVRSRLALGLSAVVDATNLDREHRLANAKLAPSDIPVEYVLIDRPLAEKL